MKSVDQDNCFIFATDSYLIPIPSQPTQSFYYGASVKRDWFADLLVAQSFENKFSVRAKTFTKLVFAARILCAVKSILII